MFSPFLRCLKKRSTQIFQQSFFFEIWVGTIRIIFFFKYSIFVTNLGNTARGLLLITSELRLKFACCTLYIECSFTGTTNYSSCVHFGVVCVWIKTHANNRAMVLQWPHSHMPPLSTASKNHLGLLAHWYKSYYRDVKNTYMVLPLDTSNCRTLKIRLRFTCLIL